MLKVDEKFWIFALAFFVFVGIVVAETTIKNEGVITDFWVNASQINVSNKAYVQDLTLSCSDCITDANVVDTITASNYLPLSGGTLTGNLNLGSNNITGVGYFTSEIPSAVTQFIRRDKDDSFLSIIGGSQFSPQSGAGVTLIGGDEATNPGHLWLYIGDKRTGKAPDSKLRLYYLTDGSALSIFEIDKVGNITKLGGFNTGSAVNFYNGLNSYEVIDIEKAGALQLRLENTNTGGSEWIFDIGDAGAQANHLLIARNIPGSTSGIYGGSAEAVIGIMHDETNRYFRVTSTSGASSVFEVNASDGMVTKSGGVNVKNASVIICDASKTGLVIFSDAFYGCDGTSWVAL